MKLYIAEKASVGRALSEVLPGPRKKMDNAVKCGSDIVAWASGHLLELYMPEDYDERYRSWNRSTLLYVPETWKRKEIARAKALFLSLKKLIKALDSRNDVIVNVGDADREGQLLIDEILEHCGWKGATERVRINDVNPSAIRKALENVKDNRDYRWEFMAGQARLYADWLVGLALTRYVTVSLREAGYDAGVMSVGRVQTPTLGLVVARDREIRDFSSSAYYDLKAVLTLSGGRSITGRWLPDEERSPILDAQKRIIDKDAAFGLAALVESYAGEVVSVATKAHKAAPPLPFSLSKLQMAASRKYDITDTLVHVQKLYEAGYVTYPRTGCEHIPEGHFVEAKVVVEAIRAACPGMEDMMGGIDLSRKSGAWNDAEISEHHAIIPTVRSPKEGSITDTERKIYELLCARYILQFLPEYEYEETTIKFKAGKELFRSTGRAVVNLGWQGWDKQGEQQEDANNEKGDDMEGKEVQILPSVREGETGEVCPSIEERTTKPPKPYSYHSLIAAMNGIHAFVKDPSIKAKLKEVQGIGTEATQENVISILFKRGYLEKRKKQVVSTELGRTLIDVLSGGKASVMVEPDLTAVWEDEMTNIEKGSVSLEDFIARVARMVRDITSDRFEVPGCISGMIRQKKCLNDACEGYLRRIDRAGKDAFFSCSLCHATFNDSNGEPVAREKRMEANCPVGGCGGTAIRFTGKKDGRLFWKCGKCGTFFDDADGRPSVRKKGEKKAPKEVV